MQACVNSSSRDAGPECSPSGPLHLPATKVSDAPWPNLGQTLARRTSDPKLQWVSLPSGRARASPPTRSPRARARGRT
ncbi:hypothetical protein AMK31_31360 [Streptomyces sp. TSRI0107]|nr:hypothetical protein AMK31_31360 [Streptomyces sp. TSRI0107]